MIGIIFSALFLGFFTGRFFLTPTAKPLLDTILMTALASWSFVRGPILQQPSGCTPLSYG